MTNLRLDAALNVVWHETLHPSGFMAKIRENQVDQVSFQRLMRALGTIQIEIGTTECLDRLFVACMYEAAWEVDNTVEHYRRVGLDVGQQVARMAQDLRQWMHEFLWDGLDPYFKDSPLHPEIRWRGHCPSAEDL